MNRKYLVTFVFADGKCIDIEVSESSVYTAHLTALMQLTRAEGWEKIGAEIVATRISLRDNNNEN